VVNIKEAYMVKKAAVVLVIILLFTGIAVNVYCENIPAGKEQQIVPRKVGVDTNFNGKPDRFEYYNEKGQVVKVESDPDEDGVIDETITYENGKPVKGTKDTNKDGKPDVWIDF
jgi:hypothetical protein